MADGGAYPPLSGSLGDLTTDAGKAQAAYELDRAELAGTEAAMSEWARRWGRAALDAFRETDGQADELEEVSDEATALEKKLNRAADKAEAICKLAEGEDALTLIGSLKIFDQVFALAEEIQELAA